MRTTVVLEDRLARQAKRLAVRRGITFSDLVGEALRIVLAEPTGPIPAFEMVTYGQGAGTTHHEPEDLATALEEDDRTALRD